MISAEELDELHGGLDQVAGELERGEFPFADDDEDIHMAIERRLTELVGPLGGKLHTGALAKRPGRDRPGALRARRARSARSSSSAR